MARPPDRRLEPPRRVGFKKDPLAFQLVPAISADRLLRKRLIHKHTRWHLDAVRADGRAKDELLASPAERADGASRLLGVEADHVDDDIEALVFEGGGEVIEAIAIADDRLHACWQR